jgi:hypothetical protein
MADRLQKPVLVLNASYEPINICAARRALVLVLKGVASAEEESVNAIHSARAAVRLPSVIRLLEYRRIPHQTRALSRKNILMRDRYTCQYCHRILPSGELTLDHVVPAVAGGRIGLGKPGSLLPSLQQPQGQPHAGRSGNATGAAAASVQPPHQPPPDPDARQERRAVAEVPVLLRRRAFQPAHDCCRRTRGSRFLRGERAGGGAYHSIRLPAPKCGG